MKKNISFCPECGWAVDIRSKPKANGGFHIGAYCTNPDCDKNSGKKLGWIEWLSQKK